MKSTSERLRSRVLARVGTESDIQTAATCLTGTHLHPGAAAGGESDATSGALSAGCALSATRPPRWHGFTFFELFDPAAGLLQIREFNIGTIAEWGSISSGHRAHTAFGPRTCQRTGSMAKLERHQVKQFRGHLLDRHMPEPLRAG
jgi:hypothetical protein